MPLLRSVILSIGFCLLGNALVAGDSTRPSTSPSSATSPFSRTQRGIPVSKPSRIAAHSPRPLATVVSDTGLSSRLTRPEPTQDSRDRMAEGQISHRPQAQKSSPVEDGTHVDKRTNDERPDDIVGQSHPRRSLESPPPAKPQSPTETAPLFSWPNDEAADIHSNADDGDDASVMRTVHEVRDVGEFDMAAPWPVVDRSVADQSSGRPSSGHQTSASGRQTSDRRSSRSASVRDARRSKRLARRAAKHSSDESCERCGPWARLFPFAFIPPSGGIGIGHERVMFAPFFTDSAQPFSHVSLRYENGWNLERPDRAEYFWAAPPTGPGPERSVDVTTLTARIETATDRASAIFEVPLRAVGPVLNSDASGIGDLTVGGKLVLVSGRDWVITQQTLTYLNTGPAARGLGTGHASIEPGLLARYRWTDETYFHGQLRYNIPFSGTNDFAGEVLIWGVGVSSIWYETDAFAVLPTFEVVGISFLDGQRTTAGGLTVNVDGETAVDLLPGVRFVLGPQGDLGLTEVGISGGASVGDTGWFSARLQIEARWSF